MQEPVNLEDGYYWVKRYEDEEFQPGYYSKVYDTWSIYSNDEDYETHYFEEIGERILPPNE